MGERRGLAHLLRRQWRQASGQCQHRTVRRCQRLRLLGNAVVGWALPMRGQCLHHTAGADRQQRLPAGALPDDFADDGQIAGA